MRDVFPLYMLLLWNYSPQQVTDDLETSLEDLQEEYKGNEDAASALLCVKQKLDGFEEGEMRSVHGQEMFEY